MVDAQSRTAVYRAMGVGICAWLWGAHAVWAQPLAPRVYDEELRIRMDQQAPSRQEVTVDGGGWLSLGMLDYDDDPASTQRTLLQSQLRGWSQVGLRDTHVFYVRGLLEYDDWKRNNSPTSRGDDSFERLERAWYGLNVGRLFGWDPSGRAELGVKAGRDFQTLGNSLVLSLPLDMLSAEAEVDAWQFRTFAGTTLYRSLNMDPSPLVKDHQDRVLWGAELAYEGLSDHRPFVYCLWNWDHTDPSAPSPAQSYQYDSRYFGVGSRGILITDEVRYAVELVLERGRTYSDGAASGRDRIEAWAFDASLEYLIPHTPSGRLTLEYMFGSGDPDRTRSAVATVGGNTVHTPDQAFNALGWRDTGMASAMALSNLHILACGASLFPWARFQGLEVGGKVFVYAKDWRDGAISDTLATLSERWVGCEWDLFCNWRWTSDLAWTLRYGMFHPGDAYNEGDDSSRDFLYTGLVFSF
ncbi:MAG: alginate export family protein [Phycisphaerae bacterium]|nr:alginate export family protein [Phycisphaerae bacterium]